MRRRVLNALREMWVAQGAAEAPTDLVSITCAVRVQSGRQARSHFHDRLRQALQTHHSGYEWRLAGREPNVAQLSFCCANSRGRLLDRRISEVADLSKARDQAKALARSLIETASLKEWQSCRTHVLDDRGAELFVMPFSWAIERRNRHEGIFHSGRKPMPFNYDESEAKVSRSEGAAWPMPPARLRRLCSALVLSAFQFQLATQLPDASGLRL